MGTVTVRELRNRGDEVLDRVARGEALVVTRDGAEVAELLPQARAYDALIAATALANDLRVYTHNPGEFARIADLSVHPV